MMAPDFITLISITMSFGVPSYIIKYIHVILKK